MSYFSAVVKTDRSLLGLELRVCGFFVVVFFFFLLFLYLVLICLKHQKQVLQVSQQFPFFSLQTSLILAASHREEEQFSALWCFLGILGTNWGKTVSFEAPAVSWRLTGASCLSEELCFSAKSLKWICSLAFFLRCSDGRNLGDTFYFFCSNKITTYTCSFKNRPCASPFLLLHLRFRLWTLCLGPLNRAGWQCAYIFI